VAGSQHGVISHAQLVASGYSAQAIHHRIRRGRLHPIYRGVYAVGRKDVTQEGEWTAAVLACGATAALSHDSAAALWQLTKAPTDRIHVSVLVGLCYSR
ncbi:MAG TPA: type IV toxin-antitoxin system AbiEi family antitoxin domain-containing protein, partial [Gaiellales bacterium]|nr:type IV toxin-antitoxin system AbiEi family antitoxin domain-containing protein [Gaiellales bacterium]